MRPPKRAWEELEGSPKSQVARFHRMAPTSPHWWVILLAGAAIGLGTYSGGWRIMRTMGKGLCDIQSPQGFAAETASTAAILASSHLGFALSTTHVCSGSILGSGVGRRTEVRWSTAGKMAVAWVVTLPAAALVGAAASWIASTGTIGTIIDVALLLVAAWLIVHQAAKTRINHENVNDAAHVGVRGGKVSEGAAA